MARSSSVVHGVVLDQGGRPVPGACVLARAPGGEIVARTHSGGDGRFRLRPTPAALRGIAWQGEPKAVLEVSPRHSDTPISLASPIPVWTLSRESEVTLRVRPVELEEGQPGPFIPAGGSRTPTDAAVALLVLGALSAVSEGALGHEQVQTGLLDGSIRRHLGAQGASPEALRVLEAAQTEGLAAARHQALELLKDAPKGPWVG